MSTAAPALAASQVCHRCDPRSLGFDSTESLEPLEEVIGQERAVAAVRFGIEIARGGYHIFAHGPGGSGKSTTLRRFLGQEAGRRQNADDLCYVYNVDEPYRPKFLRLPAGRGARLAAGMDRVIEELLLALPAAFDSESAATRRQGLTHTFEGRGQELFEGLRKAVVAEGVGLLQTPEGLTVAPITAEGPMTREAFAALPETERMRLRTALQRAEVALENMTREQRLLQREAGEAMATLEREIAASVVDHRIQELKEAFADLAAVSDFLETLRADLLNHLDLLRPSDGTDAEEEPSSAAGLDAAARARSRRRTDLRLRRWSVNVLVDHAQATGAPVHFERLPTLANLVGRIEHEQRGGSALTDHTLIKPGALHRANGGYLVIEAEDLMGQPFSWEALKRALRHQEMRIEAPNADQSPISAVGLDPEPIPLDCKVILTGPTALYFALHEADSDLSELFKVSAEFAASMERSPHTEGLLARFIATTCRNEGIRHLEAEAVARLIEYSARVAGHGQRLSNHFLDLTNLVREADYWAGKEGRKLVAAVDVLRARSERQTRADLSRQRAHEAIGYGLIVSQVSGEGIGEINGLTVLTRGDFSFGLPSRISAAVGLGEGRVADVESEVALSGAFHSKGVRILEGFLRRRYLLDEPLSLLASVTFEQSYAIVDGDSASAAELLALLSALADLPLRHDLAVTGSIDQAGRVQAIGGINEKVEGFFRVCRHAGLTGSQGVALPASNVQQLMLEDDVVAAVSEGTFHLCPVSGIDALIELFTGVEAGMRGDDGCYPPSSVNGLVEGRLRRLAERRQRLGLPLAG